MAQADHLRHFWPVYKDFLVKNAGYTLQRLQITKTPKNKRGCLISETVSNRLKSVHRKLPAAHIDQAKCNKNLIFIILFSYFVE